jgi:hypothetical protein
MTVLSETRTTYETKRRRNALMNRSRNCISHISVGPPLFAFWCQLGYLFVSVGGYNCKVVTLHRFQQ